MTNRRKNRRGHKRMNTHVPRGPISLPIVVYKDLPDMSIDTVQQTAFKVSDFLTDNTNYSYSLEHICLEVIAPSQVTAGATWCAVDTLLFQVFGYMKQDEMLQRNPMSTWRSVDKRTKRFSFNRNYIASHIFVGGKVPITNVNDDAIFGCHASWSSGSANTAKSLLMRLTVKVRCIFSLSQDLTIIKISHDGFRSYLGGTVNHDPNEQLVPNQPAIKNRQFQNLI